jgi:hypothetical protein
MGKIKKQFKYTHKVMIEIIKTTSYLISDEQSFSNFLTIIQKAIIMIQTRQNNETTLPPIANPQSGGKKRAAANNKLSDPRSTWNPADKQFQSAHPTLPTKPNNSNTSNQNADTQNSHPIDTSKDPLHRIPINQSMCLELLIEGHVGSYIDFFNMVIQNKTTTTYTLPHLTQLKHLLTVSEDAQRSADKMRIYQSKKNIALFFHERGETARAVVYFKEALEASKALQTVKEVEIEASINLGSVLEQSGGLPSLLYVLICFLPILVIFLGAWGR